MVTPRFFQTAYNSSTSAGEAMFSQIVTLWRCAASCSVLRRRIAESRLWRCRQVALVHPVDAKAHLLDVGVACRLDIANREFGNGGWECHGHLANPSAARTPRMVRRNTADQLRGAHDLALARRMTAARGMADTVIPLASNRPSSAAFRLFCSAGAPPQRRRQRSRTGPDRTPDSLHGARLRDRGGCGTARPSEPTSRHGCDAPEHGGPATWCLDSDASAAHRAQTQ